MKVHLATRRRSQAWIRFGFILMTALLADFASSALMGLCGGVSLVFGLQWNGLVVRFASEIPGILVLAAASRWMYSPKAAAYACAASVILIAVLEILAELISGSHTGPLLCQVDFVDIVYAALITAAIARLWPIRPDATVITT